MLSSYNVVSIWSGICVYVLKRVMGEHMCVPARTAKIGMTDIWSSGKEVEKKV